MKVRQITERYKQGKAPGAQLKGKEPMPKAKPGRKDHPHGGRLVGEQNIDEAAPIVAAAIWVIKFAIRYGAWPVIKWLLKKHGGKIMGGAAAAYYIDQGWDWVVSKIGKEYAQMLMDNKFEIGMAVALILGAVALKKFLERKGEALAAKYSEAMYETATAGGTSAGGVASIGTGFASGGIGTISRAGTVKKRKAKKKKT